jgi:glutamyl/glutaminyl-tRNA synthetase
MCLNFESAFKWLGAGPDRTDVTFRYDDTNPEAESMEYIENQVALVLGTVRCVSIR